MAVTSPLPDVAVLVMSGRLHLTAAKVAGQGRGLQLWHQCFQKKIGFGIYTKSGKAAFSNVSTPRSIFENVQFH